jgi:hypothetical protein
MVNPARSLGPAIFVGGTALQQLWLFLVVPLPLGPVPDGWCVRKSSTSERKPVAGQETLICAGALRL